MDRPWNDPINSLEGFSDGNRTPQNVDIQQEIMQKTLEEVAHEKNGNATNPCVICLELVSEPAIAVPCKHANYDFLCLVSWLETRQICPLCKSDVTAVEYQLDSPEGPKVYQLPAHIPSTPANSTATIGSQRPHFTADRPHGVHHRRPFSRRPEIPRLQPVDDQLSRRQHVYRHQLYSLRVGSNRLSQYQELIPERFQRDEELVSRARKWIRRELKVFDFLNPETETGPSRPGMTRPGQERLQNRRGSNAEFLLEYVIAILRTVDIKGSAGQAELLLRDFLGRDNACLFLHELQAWLRSPYTSLEDWDRHVQYDDRNYRSIPSPRARPLPDRTATPIYRNNGRPARGRITKPSPSRRSQHQGSRDPLAQARRVQYARDRYMPD
ncbi:hypothetical protein BDV25DRAFT_136347 [Aspergillus avenaceus]|uniref:RING-type E3 ubiquitin transferase n=1 Tax=Aspergillus avenaceus TaxID=36643 RepID=A0A5N6U5Q9_ASPAV|nr:hypothetical protein BDV25DRAFT_136347 [Aspergillus avenaceus]